MPRPRLLNESKQSEVCLFLATGCSLETVARHVGCTTATILRETKRNQGFAERVRLSRRSAELNPVNTMRQAAQSDWRAAAWLLERTQPAQFAKRAPNTFSQEEVATLLSRACEVFRRETRDAEKYARIKRSIIALAKQVAAASSMVDADPAFDSPQSAEIKSSEITSSGITSSGITSSGITSSGITSSGITSSGITSSGITSSGITSSGITSSGITSSGITSAELTLPANRDAPAAGRTDHPAASTESPPSNAANSAPAHASEQNEREWDGELICMGDIKPRTAKTYEAAVAAE